LKDIPSLRHEIDGIDDQMASLFLSRMSAVREIAYLKALSANDIEDKDRENDIKARIRASLPRELHRYSNELFDAIFEISRAYQADIISSENLPEG